MALNLDARRDPWWPDATTAFGGPLVFARIPTACARREMVDRCRPALRHARRSIDRAVHSSPLTWRPPRCTSQQSREAASPGRHTRESARRAEGPRICPTDTQRTCTERGCERHDRSLPSPVAAQLRASAITVQSSAGNPTLVVRSPIRPLNAPRWWPIRSPRRPPTWLQIWRDHVDPKLSTSDDVTGSRPGRGTDDAGISQPQTRRPGGCRSRRLPRPIGGPHSAQSRQIGAHAGSIGGAYGPTGARAVPYDKPSRRTPSLIPDRPRGQVAEAVRQLRVNLRSAGTGSGGTSLLVTSAVAGEGKTSLVCNLAAAFGLEGDRVLLIDADLRQPSVGNYLGIHPTPGLSTVLLGECQPHDAIVSWRGGLFDVLTSGPIPETPSELLGSDRTSLMLTELESRYDVILIDSPALLPVADGSVLARACDAALLVVRNGHTPDSEVTDALAALRAVSANVLGCAFSMEPQPSRTFRSRTNYSPVQKAERPNRFAPLNPNAARSEHNEPPTNSNGISQSYSAVEEAKVPDKFVPFYPDAAQYEHNGEPPTNSVGISQSAWDAMKRNDDPTMELLSGAATEEALRTETDAPVSSVSESSGRRSQPGPVPRTDVTPSRTSSQESTKPARPSS